jgi:GNAT superfamily N-acetyltransferase
MVTIVEAAILRDRDIIRDLFAEYLQWVCSRLRQEYGAVVDAESILMHDMKTLEAFFPPRGLFFLSFAGEVPAGCACIRTIANGIAELKRMYVRPCFRGKGIGTALVQVAIRKIQQLGYFTVRLDSAGFMSDAHRLYRSLGFRDITPYEGSDVPKERQKDCVFMQLDLVLSDENGLSS